MLNRFLKESSHKEFTEEERKFFEKFGENPNISKCQTRTYVYGHGEDGYEEFQIRGQQDWHACEDAEMKYVSSLFNRGKLYSEVFSNENTDPTSYYGFLFEKIYKDDRYLRYKEITRKVKSHHKIGSITFSTPNDIELYVKDFRDKCIDGRNFTIKRLISEECEIKDKNKGNGKDFRIEISEPKNNTESKF